MIEKVGPFVLVGTSHVAKESVVEIEKALNDFSPEVVGIELDHQRLRSLYSKEKPSLKAMIKEFGVFGALFASLASSVQKKMAKSLGVEPGLDMKAGYEKSREKKIPVALIDVPISTTLKRISAIPFYKKVNMTFALIFKSFKKKYRKTLEFDTKTGVPEEKQIIAMLEIVRKEVPLLYDILIEKRNIHMSKRLLKLEQEHKGTIVAVVGAGHIKGMKEYLEKNLPSDDAQSTYSFVID